MIYPRISDCISAEDLNEIFSVATELTNEAMENRWLSEEEQQQCLDLLYHVMEHCERAMREWADLYSRFLEGEKELRLSNDGEILKKIFFIPACPKQCSRCSGTLVDYCCQKTVQCPCSCHNALARKIVARIFDKLIRGRSSP